MRKLKIASVASVAAAAALTLGGCGMLSGGVYDTPLPGGADLGSSPMTIEADFDDVLDLVPQSSVKVDNVAVGRVDKIRLNSDGHSARVRIKVNGDVDLPAGTTARLQQTSLLGEKYVALVRPETPVAGPALKTGAKLGIAETSQAAQVEQVLGALSMVLNGGGIGQFQEISRGAAADLRGTTRADQGLPQRDEHLRLRARRPQGVDHRSPRRTERAVQDPRRRQGQDRQGARRASPGMKVMVEQRKQFVAMLTALDKLSGVTVDTLDKAQEDIIADFKALEPILQQLAKAGADLPNSLEILLTYPFPDSVLGAIKGDYLNVFIETNFRTVPSGCAAIGCVWPQPVGASGVSGTSFRGASEEDAAPTLLPPTSSPVPGATEPTITVPTPSPSDSPSPTGSPSPQPSETSGSTPSPDPTTPSSSDSPSPDPSRENKDGDN
ncbi:MlaD family protein [Aeromicrobium sp. UC242_57]|uniref:MlaD family protein n=1 Tax=Aeromicrobium sp. UC242_57 TaxID=3374624 RepID=UPI00379AC197